jgi:hypothetical protein
LTLAGVWRGGRAVECSGLEMPQEAYQRVSDAVYTHADSKLVAHAGSVSISENLADCNQNATNLKAGLSLKRDPWNNEVPG